MYFKESTSWCLHAFLFQAVAWWLLRSPRLPFPCWCSWMSICAKFLRDIWSQATPRRFLFLRRVPASSVPLDFLNKEAKHLFTPSSEGWDMWWPLCDKVILITEKGTYKRCAAWVSGRRWFEGIRHTGKTRIILRSALCVCPYLQFSPLRYSPTFSRARNFVLRDAVSFVHVPFSQDHAAKLPHNICKGASIFGLRAVSPMHVPRYP